MFDLVREAVGDRRAAALGGCERAAARPHGSAMPRWRPGCSVSATGGYPVLRMPLAMPLTVSSSARHMRGSGSSVSRTRPRSEAWR